MSRMGKHIGLKVHELSLRTVGRGRRRQGLEDDSYKTQGSSEMMKYSKMDCNDGCTTL